MNNRIKSVKKAVLLAGCMFSCILSASADDIQKSLNLDYFRTPEAAAFKKYGEESVNEYTGTADISVPLYTIKCKDVEIPLVLRYDASGIKVEQEASWVGLGWNLMVGGCINYVCAGGHDRYTSSTISDQTWMEYLTTMYTFSGGRQYFHYATDNRNTWMETVPHDFAFDPPYGGNLSLDMKNYLMWGYGERDFYSVNVLGKSFKFFIDPTSLKPYIIGEAGEDYKIDPYYTVEKTGIGNQPDVSEWTITDSDGYVYRFGNGDTLFDEKGWAYTSSWYLTEIQTPLGEKVELSYTTPSEWNRGRRTESYSILSKSVSNTDMAYGSQGYTSYTNHAKVKNTHLIEISTSNQTVTFTTSPSKECSGRRLDAITVKSSLGNKPVIKTFRFSYGSFGYSNVGGNVAPAGDSQSELRLKLDNVKEITSTETLTTSFSYNSLNLPSKRSCAQDYWGYYNGQDNPKTNDVGFNGHTLIPTPKPFMSKFYNDELKNIKGANRNSNGAYMQAAILNKVIYPTGGYTTYEYEPNICAVTKSDADIPYDIDIDKYYSYTPDVPAGTSQVNNVPYNFTLTEDLDYSLEVKCTGDAINGTSISIIIVSPGFGGVPLLFPMMYQNLNDYITVNQGTLPAGNYQLIIGAPGTGNQGYGIHCKLKGYYQSTASAQTYEKTVGGLRVKKISNYDYDNTLVNYVTYDYNDNNGTTGILLNATETIDFFSYTYLKNEQNGHGPATVYSRHPINGLTISTGQTRFPAFYESCNPGIVGYSQVTKRKYNASGNLEKSIVTSYVNHKPKSITRMDYYDCFDNGKILCQEIKDTNGRTIQKVENEYRLHNYGDDPDLDKWYSTNMQAIDGIRIDPGIQYIDEYGKDFDNRYMIWKYPYILSWIELSKTTTTEYGANGTVVRTKKYSYNPIYHQVSQIDQNTSLSNQTHRTKITHTADGLDIISRNMKAAHRLNDVVENKEILVVNNIEKPQSTQHITFTGKTVNGSTCYLPYSLSTSMGSEALETRSQYSYDAKGNICSINIDGIETVYIWSYKGLYPIARIDGLTYAGVKAAVGEAAISTLLDKTTPSASDLSSLRKAVKNAGGHITTYTFKPLVGITSATKPNGQTVNYDYDASGRLVKVSDPQGVLQKYQYNYKIK